MGLGGHPVGTRRGKTPFKITLEKSPNHLIFKARPRPELNRGSRFCRPLRHHSATWPSVIWIKRLASSPEEHNGNRARTGSRIDHESLRSPLHRRFDCRCCRCVPVLEEVAVDVQRDARACVPQTAADCQHILPAAITAQAWPWRSAWKDKRGSFLDRKRSRHCRLTTSGFRCRRLGNRRLDRTARHRQCRSHDGTAAAPSSAP